MKTKIGILYGLSHYSWFQYKKCGRTTQTINKRVSNLKTSLLGNINIIYTTNLLVDCCFYEYLMKRILKNYRIKPNKEMFDVYDEDIKEIFETFNYINSICDTEEKLNWYIQNHHPEYFKNRKCVKSESSSSSDKPKSKKRRGLYIDTSY
jgi:hypothetical protein